MPLEELELTLNDDLSYRISVIQSVDVRSTKTAFSIAPPGLASAENILMGVQGMEADLSLNFMAHDDGTDKADGTASSSVVTIEEQLSYLEHEIQSPDFGASWTLDHLTGNAFDDDEVFYETYRAPLISQESPRWRPTSIDLRRGRSIG